MTAALELTSAVTRGRLSATAQKALEAALAKLEGKTVVLSLSLYRKRRGSKQNRYYWGVVVKAVTEMFRDAGNYADEEDIHEFLKLRIGKLKQMLVAPDGEVYKSLGSTAKLTTTEFMDYIEKIRAWAAQFGVEIPDPQPEGKI